MKNTILLIGALVLVVIVAVTLMQGQKQTTLAVDGKPCIGCSVDGKTTPRMADGHPNLNGYWSTPRRTTDDPGQFLNREADGSFLFEFGENFDESSEVCLDDSCQVDNQPPYKAEYMPRVKEIAATMYLGTSALDPIMGCRPEGVPRAGLGAVQLVQTPELIAVLYEAAPSSVYRVIYMDGRPVPEDMETSYFGFSSGHWEGETLVVDTVNINDDTWVAGSNHGRAKYTSIHSEKMKVQERWTRVGNTLSVDTTVEDPEMFTKPWVIPTRKVQMSNPGEYLRETICNYENATQEHIQAPTEQDKGQLFLGSKTNAIGK